MGLHERHPWESTHDFLDRRDREAPSLKAPSHVIDTIENAVVKAIRCAVWVPLWIVICMAAIPTAIIFGTYMAFEKAIKERRNGK